MKSRVILLIVFLCTARTASSLDFMDAVCAINNAQKYVSERWAAFCDNLPAFDDNEIDDMMMGFLSVTFASLHYGGFQGEAVVGDEFFSDFDIVSAENLGADVGIDLVGDN